MEAKLGLYDLLARLLPGGFLLWALQRIGIMTIPWNEPAKAGVADAVIAIIVAYITGLLANIAGIWLIQPLLFLFKGQPSKKYLANRKSLFSTFRSTPLAHGLEFKEDSNDAHEAFRRALAAVEDSSTKVQAIQAQFGLHRTLAGAGLILVIASIVNAVHSDGKWIFAIGWMSFTVVFSISAYKWGYSLVQNVFYIATVKYLPSRAEEPNK